MSVEALLERLAILDQQIEVLQARLTGLRQRDMPASIETVERTLSLLIRSRDVLGGHLSEVQAQGRVRDAWQAAAGAHGPDGEHRFTAYGFHCRVRVLADDARWIAWVDLESIAGREPAITATRRVAGSFSTAREARAAAEVYAKVVAFSGLKWE